MSIQRTSIAVFLMFSGCDSEPTRYEDMNFEQRREFMTDIILPEMQRTFVEFEAEFATMTCATCHGGGASDGTYAMPSPDLPRLPPTEEAFIEYVKDPEHARWSQFMMDDVWPQMIDLLDVEPFDPMKNLTGFSCSNCHMAEGQ
jgi:hypothetical protein